ncbi:MAG TPA: PfkB family carbohydrate kinase [Solirubrobacteraceae bacterium]|nr:PfkB family carbohydrate kinase [Solirubrobacteraceae bacterium]
MRLARVQVRGEPGAHEGRPRVASVGHIEWVQFARVEHVPRPGEVAHAKDAFEEPAGGGAVAAVQLARLAGDALLLTALGEDEAGRRSHARLAQFGVDVRAAARDAPTRRAVTLVDDRGERTITTFGERLEPLGEEPLGWDELGRMDAVYFTAGDLAALRAARAAAVLVASPRARHALGHGVRLDALVLSADDAIERREAARAEAEADVVVLTDGARGGTYYARDGHTGSWAAASPPGAPVDSYGCGDSFAAGLAYGLGAGMELDRALALGARCGAFCLTGHGPYERQLTAADLAEPDLAGP